MAVVWEALAVVPIFPEDPDEKEENIVCVF